MQIVHHAGLHTQRIQIFTILAHIIPDSATTPVERSSAVDSHTTAAGGCSCSPAHMVLSGQIQKSGPSEVGRIFECTMLHNFHEVIQRAEEQPNRGYLDLSTCDESRQTASSRFFELSSCHLCIAWSNEPWLTYKAHICKNRGYARHREY